MLVKSGVNKIHIKHPVAPARATMPQAAVRSLRSAPLKRGELYKEKEWLRKRRRSRRPEQSKR